MKPRDGSRDTARVSPETPTPAPRPRNNSLYTFPIALTYGEDDSSSKDPQLPTHESRLGQPEDLNDDGLSLAEHRYHSFNSGELAEEVDCTSSTAHKEVSEQEFETSLPGEEEEEEEEEKEADAGDQVNDGSNC